MPDIHTLIFTDLDGTLLDDRYDLTNAAAALDAVVELGAVAIPVTSKTRWECDALNSLRQHKAPVIFENGAGIRWHDLRREHMPEVEIEGPGYEALCEHLRRVRRHGQFKFRGFSLMNAAEVADRCGLDLEQVPLALAREATEPLLWQDTESARRVFAEYLSMFQLELLEGGRFWHVMPPTDKGQAAAKVVERWRLCFGTAPRTLGCGDSPNDLALLEYTDHSLLFPRRDGSYLDLHGKPVSHAPVAGHEAWFENVQQLLHNHSLKPLEDLA